MVIAAFQPGEKYAANYTTLDQYDYGQILRIQGLKLPKTVEVHFSTQETGGTSLTRVGVTKDGVTDVLIPDSVLENGDTTQNYSIFAFVYITDATSGKTEYRARLEVKARPKPEVPGGGDNPDIFHEAVLEVRKSAEKAEEAQKQAEGYAHGREDLPERAEDNAMYYAGKTSEDAKKTAQDRAEVERLTESNTQMQGKVAEDLEEVKKLSSQAQTSATNAALSEQKSKEAATRAETAQTGAETAEDNAELAAQKTGQDKTAVEQAKKLVQQIGQEVLDNKNAVDKTVQDFNLTAQQALADVNNAGQTQTERVQSAGTTAVENIDNAQNTATRAVETAKVEAVKAVQTEGTKQTGTVTAEGEKQVQAVQTAAQEIIADREQIQKNETEIAELRQNKADAIVETASGTLLNVKDSANAFFEDFSMSGKTTQNGTPTPDAPVPIVSAGESGNIEVKITGKNLINVSEDAISSSYNVGSYTIKNGVITFDTANNWGGDFLYFNDIDVSKNKELVFQMEATLPEKQDTETDGAKILFKAYNKLGEEIKDSESAISNDTWKMAYNNHYKGLMYYKRGSNISVEFSSMVARIKVGVCFLDNIAKKHVIIKKYQAECGTVSTAYEPYKEPQTLTLQLDRPLTKWDRLEKREGVWGIVRQGETKVLKATPEEKWAAWEDKQNAFFLMNDKKIKEGLCSHFEAKGSLEIGKETGIYLSETVHLIVTDMNINSLENWKTWLQANPITVAYKTAEETWEPLPEEMQSVLNALHTNYPTTVVSNSENAEMQLTYVADTKNYTDRKIEVAVTAQVQNLANLLSLMPLSTQAAMIENDTNNILDMEVQK